MGSAGEKMTLGVAVFTLLLFVAFAAMVIFFLGLAATLFIAGKRLGCFPVIGAFAVMSVLLGVLLWAITWLISAGH